MKRINWIDYAKGIGIILVILGHSIFPETLKIWICSFHMPLFFMLSGFTFNIEKYNDFKSFVKRKFKTLIIPYFIFSIVNWFWIIARNRNNLSLTFKKFIGILVQIGNTDFGPGLWFVPCLFLSELFLYVLVKHLDKKILAIASIVMVTIGVAYARFINVNLPWGIDVVPISSAFVCLGYLIKNKTDIILSYKLMPIYLVANIIFCYLNFRILGESVGMWSSVYGNEIYYILASVFGSFLIYSICKLISNLNFLLHVGQNSITYYCLHVIVVGIVEKVYKIIIPSNVMNMTFILGIVTLIITLIAMYYASEIYNKIKLRLN